METKIFRGVLKIAITSCGLWHVQRGIETWAGTLAETLKEYERNVTLFCGSRRKDTGQHVVSGNQYSVDNRKPETVVIPCLCRGMISNRLLTGIFSRLGGWRYGFGSEYQTEQTTMALHLIRTLRKGSFDIVHLQDPWLALLLERAWQNGKHGAKVILAHGTEESVEFLDRFNHIQELSPYYMDRHNGRIGAAQTRHSIPNFVNTAVFKPADKNYCRKAFKLPEESFIVLSVGAVNHKHKQMRCLIDEFAMAGRENGLLVIAGSCDGESGFDLVAYANKLLGKRFRYFGDINHSEMPKLYSSADLFVLCSRSEIFGIAFLEAMASGIPCIGHKYPVTEWIIGDGGSCIDMTVKGEVEKEIRRYLDPDIRQHAGALARKRTVEMFSSAAVTKQIIAMYESIIEKKDELQQPMTVDRVR